MKGDQVTTVGTRAQAPGGLRETVNSAPQGPGSLGVDAPMSLGHPGGC